MYNTVGGTENCKERQDLTHQHGKVYLEQTQHKSYHQIGWKNNTSTRSRHQLVVKRVAKNTLQRRHDKRQAARKKALNEKYSGDPQVVHVDAAKQS